MLKTSASILAVFMIIALITKPEIASQGAYEGIEMCLKSVVPALFPMSFLIGYVSDRIIGMKSKFLRLISKACKIPAGGESIFILSLICGYPIGAQMIASLYKNGSLDYKSSCRLMGFCNNAGPAFLFGIASTVFRTSFVAWFIWTIQIASSILVGVILPCNETAICHPSKAIRKSPSSILRKSLQSISMVCGWVIIFRVFATYIKHFLSNKLPPLLYISLLGVLEMTNGSLELQHVANEAYRLVAFNVFLSFGGLCVWMQILSATNMLGSRMFYVGKLLHTAISTILVLLLQLIIYSNGVSMFSTFFLIIALSVIVFATCLIIHKNSSRNKETSIV